MDRHGDALLAATNLARDPVRVDPRRRYEVRARPACAAVRSRVPVAVANGRSSVAGAVAVVAGAAALKLILASRLGVLADEALYWVWSGRPALGYYDQPPLVAWSLAATRAIAGDSPFALRIVPIACGALAPLLLLRFADDRFRLALWCSSLPILFGLTFFATPDALLLAAWAGALAGACAGGPKGWLAAGACAGLAFLSKYTGAAVLPLAIAALGPREWRSPWPWAGLALAVGIASPNLWWNAQHEWVTFGFQLTEGVANAHPPGPVGPLLVALGQLAAVTPVAAIAGSAWMFRTPVSRVQRIGWATSAPLFAGFALAALGGPPEAPWPAPAWLGVGLGIAAERGRIGRIAEVGAWLGAIATLVACLHAVRPIVDLPDDPRFRFEEGSILSQVVGAWALPTGALPGEPRAAAAVPVYTERYQEAALIAYYERVPTTVLPGCGRRGQYDLWAEEDGFQPASHAFFVRPTRGGPPTCLGDRWPEVGGPHRIEGIDAWGRAAGHWDLFELGAAP
jgi:hypothetical protein